MSVILCFLIVEKFLRKANPNLTVDLRFDLGVLSMRIICGARHHDHSK